MWLWKFVGYIFWFAFLQSLSTLLLALEIKKTAQLILWPQIGLNQLRVQVGDQRVGERESGYSLVLMSYCRLLGWLHVYKFFVRCCPTQVSLLSFSLHCFDNHISPCLSRTRCSSGGSLLSHLVFRCPSLLPVWLSCVLTWYCVIPCLAHRLAQCL